MKTEKVLVMTAGVLLASLAYAETKIFPAAGGDVSDAATWGAVGFPDVDDIVGLDQPGDYTASSDISFGQFKVGASDVNINFGANRKVTLSEPTSTSSTALEFGVQGVENVVSGGYWYAPYQGRVHFLTHANHVPTEASSLMVSQSVLTNHYAAVFIVRLNDSSVMLTDGAKLYVNADVTGTEKSNVAGVVFTNNVVIISDGSMMDVGRHFYPDASGRDNGFIVKDEGSVLKVRGTVYHGGGTGTVLRVTDNAHAETKSVICGRSGAYNRFIIDNGASADMIGLTIGQNSGTLGNGAEILGAGEVSCGSVKLGSNASYITNSYLVVSNSVITTSSWNVGRSDGTCVGSKLVLKGASTYVTCTNSSVFEVGGGSEIVWEVPAEGFAEIPLQLTKYKWTSDDIVFSVKCKEFRRRGGGKIELFKAISSSWVNLDSGCLDAIIVKMNAKSATTGCSFAIEGDTLVCTIAPLPGLVISIK